MGDHDVFEIEGDEFAGEAWELDVEVDAACEGRYFIY